MDKIQPEIRCVGKGGVKFIPKNLVEKPGFLTKHGLEVEDLATSAITSFHKSVAEEPETTEEEIPMTDDEILEREIEAEDEKALKGKKVKTDKK